MVSHLVTGCRRQTLSTQSAPGPRIPFSALKQPLERTSSRRFGITPSRTGRRPQTVPDHRAGADVLNQIFVRRAEREGGVPEAKTFSRSGPLFAPVVRRSERSPSGLLFIAFTGAWRFSGWLLNTPGGRLTAHRLVRLSGDEAPPGKNPDRRSFQRHRSPRPPNGTGQRRTGSQTGGRQSGQRSVTPYEIS